MSELIITDTTPDDLGKTFTAAAGEPENQHDEYLQGIANNVKKGKAFAKKERVDIKKIDINAKVSRRFGGEVDVKLPEETGSVGLQEQNESGQDFRLGRNEAKFSTDHSTADLVQRLVLVLDRECARSSLHNMSPPPSDDSRFNFCCLILAMRLVDMREAGDGLRVFRDLLNNTIPVTKELNQILELVGDTQSSQGSLLEYGVFNKVVCLVQAMTPYRGLR